MKRMPSDIYLPPWKAPATRPAPKNSGQYFAALKKYHFGIEGGGLWDWEQDPSAGCVYCLKSNSGLCFKHAKELFFTTPGKIEE